jgi:hypothetical protein
MKLDPPQLDRALVAAIGRMEIQARGAAARFDLKCDAQITRGIGICKCVTPLGSARTGLNCIPGR